MKQIFNFAGALGVGFGVSNFMHSRPHLGAVSVVLGAAFIGAAEGIKQYQDAKAESKLTKIIPLAVEQPEVFVLTGETKKQFVSRVTCEMMDSLRDENKEGGEEVVCAVVDVTPVNPDIRHKAQAFLVRHIDH